MKPAKYFLFISLIFLCHLAQAQVKTDFNNAVVISNQGRFMKDYEIKIDFEIPAKDINSLLDAEKREQLHSNETKPFKLAVPVAVDLNIARLANWTYDNENAYGKFTISVKGALSASINFNQFYLPKGTEMYIYNENGNMITGPVTENENNVNKIWGSWVYQGATLNIEIKIPIAAKNELLLHASNIAYGYKEVYITKVGGFGQSGPCNVNVICPLGTGWEPERNSVATTLSANGGEFCSGSLVMNACNTNTPYFLTANHCFNGNSNSWRFNFQAWSPTCPNPGSNVSGVMYNGSTFRARNAASDFCLLELNTTPPANSGIHYAGWTSSTTPAQNATGLHHPSGDLMKISRADNPVSIASAFGSVNQHWRVDWSPQNNGNGQTVTPVTEPVSSGSPLFNQDHRIIGQLHGGPSFCGGSALRDYYGRFDLSWTGGGTNATRLSNWLDPTNTGAVTTNTTNIAQLTPAITGPDGICLPATSAVYSINNLPTCGTNSVIWSTNVPQVTVTPTTGNTTTVSANGYTGLVTLTATISGFVSTAVNKLIYIGTLPSCSTRVAYWYVNDYQTTLGKCASLTQIRCNNSNSNILSLCEYYATAWVVDPTAASSITWSYVSSSGYTSWFPKGLKGDSVEVVINYNSPNGWLRLKCTTTNACGSYDWDFWFTPQGSTANCPVYLDQNCLNPSLTVITNTTQEKIIIMPNPAKGQFVVFIKSEDKNAEIKEIIIRNKMGIQVYQQKFVNKQKRQTINLTNQPTDVYIVEVFDGIKWVTEKLSLQR